MGTLDFLHYFQLKDNPHISARNLSLYADDAWRVSDRLTLNFGLRWEYNPPPTASSPGLLAMQGNPANPATIILAPQDTNLYKTNYHDFAPRLGFAYSVNNGSQFGTVFRGGGGVFFDTGQAAAGAEASQLQYPYLYSTPYLTNIPFAGLDVTKLVSSSLPFPQGQLFLTDPHLNAPRTYDWSLTMEQKLGTNTSLATSYVGNRGGKLLKTNDYQGLSPSLANDLVVTSNGESSSYNALQMQFRSRMSKRLNVLASYTWAHALDTGSSDFQSVGGFQKNYRANSDGDIRHTFSSAIHYSPKGFTSTPSLKVLTSGWSLDSIVLLQGAAPFSVYSFSASDPNLYNPYADVVPGVPSVIHGPECIVIQGGCPGGKGLNPAAFVCAGGEPCSTSVTRDGTSPRNGYRLFGLTQLDLAVSRSWLLREGTSLSFRVDAFNVPNHASFSQPFTFWGAPTFGRATATYATAFGANSAGGGLNQVFSNGGARSLQLNMRLRF
jgi:hypothetical protein